MCICVWKRDLPYRGDWDKMSRKIQIISKNCFAKIFQSKSIDMWRRAPIKKIKKRFKTQNEQN